MIVIDRWGMVKLHKINIVASSIVIVLSIATFVYSFFNFVSEIHLIFAIVNILWLVYGCFINFKRNSSKKNKILYLLGFLWSIFLSVNIIFLYFNIFVEFVVYSSLFLIMIIEVVAYSERMYTPETTLIDMFLDSPWSVGIIALIISFLPILIVGNSIKEIKNLNKEHNI